MPALGKLQSNRGADDAGAQDDCIGTCHGLPFLPIPPSSRAREGCPLPVWIITARGAIKASRALPGSRRIPVMTYADACQRPRFRLARPAGHVWRWRHRSFVGLVASRRCSAYVKPYLGPTWYSCCCLFSDLRTDPGRLASATLKRTALYRIRRHALGRWLRCRSLLGTAYALDGPARQRMPELYSILILQCRASRRSRPRPRFAALMGLDVALLAGER